MAKKKGRKIRIRQGNKVNLPALDVGEPAFTLDTKELYIGSADGNVNLSGFEIIEASTTQKGISQLNDEISSTSTTESATPNAVKKVNDKINTHQNESIVSETGVHDFRYKNGVLQIKVNGSWIDYISGNSGSGGSGNVTQAEKDSWNAKSDFSGSYSDLLNKPTILSPVVLNDTLTSTSTTEGLTAKQGNVISNKIVAHTGDSDIHVTTTEKTTWNDYGVRIYELENSTASQSTNYSVPVSTTWIGTVAPYTQTITVIGISSTDNPIVFPMYSSSNTTAIAEQEAWSSISKITTANNTVTVTCFEDKPTTSLVIQLKVVR